MTSRQVHMRIFVQNMRFLCLNLRLGGQGTDHDTNADNDNDAGGQRTKRDCW